MAQFTKYTGNLTGQNGSLITALDAALVTGEGWDNSFAGGGANKKIYRPAGGNQFYFRVDDGGSGTGGAKEALIRGAESWTDIDTPNVNPFPDAAQSALTADSLMIRKSVSADATNRAYIIYADDRTAIMFVKSEATTYYAPPIYFGDFYSLVTADGYRTILIANNIENNAPSSTYAFHYSVIGNSFGDSTVGLAGHFIARNYLGTGTSMVCRKYADYKTQSTGGLYIGSGMIAPNPANGGIYLTRVHITEYTSLQYVYRGRLRGFWGWCHTTQPYADADTFSGTGELTGKTYDIVNPIQTAATANTACIETSNTLETN